MRLYCKLALLVLVACAGQALLSSGVAGETYFAMRCLVANVAGDQTLERRLIAECEDQFIAERERATVVVAYNAMASR